MSYNAIDYNGVSIIYGDNIIVYDDGTGTDIPFIPVIPPAPTPAPGQLTPSNLLRYVVQQRGLQTVFVDVERANPNYQPEEELPGHDPVERHVILQQIECLIMPSTTPQTTLPTGEVITNPPYKARFFGVYPQIQEGDVIVAVGRSRLFVDNVYAPPGVDYLSCELTETAR